MQLAGMQFAVSPEARQKAENEMLADAIAAFRARAEIARSALGGKSYRIQRLGLNTSSNGAPPRPMLRAMAADAAMAAPPVEAGESVILVNASGSVEID
jgi:predicted secreted protein